MSMLLLLLLSLRVLVTEIASSGLDERVYLLLIHTTSNYTNYSAIALSTLHTSLLHPH
jgi:hypothetical protein